MPIPPEKRAEAKAKLLELTSLYAGHCSYPYSQAAELKKTWLYRNSDGVCFAMSLDWLRRKLYNVYNLSQKHEFDDPKYDSNRNRARLTKKHGRLHAVYKQDVKDSALGRAKTTNHISAMVAANVVKSGLDKLTVGQSDFVWNYQLDDRPETRAQGMGTANPRLTFADKLYDAIARAEKLLSNEDAVGILFHMRGDGGHATAFLLDETDIRFFDPNVGEYFFSRMTEKYLALRFVSKLWFDIYHHYLKFDSLEFEPVQYQWRLKPESTEGRPTFGTR